ncbi:Glycosyl transferase, family 25 [Rhodopirellula islandica]|uniref:Glycosyl transferase, family 25 n=2 Tax=Rhodopirellula islandica TaxID=595434 RepID=A0A0J1B6L2_RHOIS|nr:Glycosyl transferase, family 25 [Rhodopirellula islandica]
MQELADFFDRVVVISLARSRDRLEAFYSQLPSPWPFAPPSVMRAIDGKMVKPPPGYQAKPPAGSWGCFRSHYRVLEDALNDGLDSILIFEDDVAFVPEFAERAQTFFAALPADWEIIYLGGKHLHKEVQLPIHVNPEVYRPFNVHSAFAYGLRGRSTIEQVYEHINSPEQWGRGHCIDHRLGEMHHTYPGGVYVPAKWLAGHRAGRSTIRSSENPDEFFPDADWLCNAPVGKQFVAIAGNNDQLTMAVASAIHLLGIPVGENRRAERIGSPLIAQSVAPGLNRTIGHLYDSVWWEPSTHFDHRVALLRQWASRRCTAIKNRHRTLLAAYHECLPIMWREVLAAWNAPMLLLVESTKPRSLPSSPTAATQVRHRKLSEAWRDINEIDPSKLIRCTERELHAPDRCLEKIAADLGATVPAEQLAAASNFLRQHLKDGLSY